MDVDALWQANISSKESYQMFNKFNWIETSTLLISYIWPIEKHLQCE
jgi:hypothetical protein